MKYSLFVSPHGFGHAARSCAIMEEIERIDSDARFVVYTLVPEWFFTSSVMRPESITFQSFGCDVGFVQSTSLHEDLPATVAKLHELYPLHEVDVTKLSQELICNGTDIVVCDIAVVGIAAAEGAGLPSVLVENFTWDWIYSAYRSEAPELGRFVEYLEPLYKKATTRVQCAPVCVKQSGAILVGPVARRQRDPGALRGQLCIPENHRIVLLTMGGVPGNFDFYKLLSKHDDITFILAGVEDFKDAPSNVRCVPPRLGVHHPDLVAAADAIVGKAGYSTVCEAYFGGTQFLYVPRPRFPESEVMEDFLKRHLSGVAISQCDFESGRWLSTLRGNLTQVPPSADLLSPGAVEAAAMIVSMAAKRRDGAVYALGQ